MRHHQINLRDERPEETVNVEESLILSFFVQILEDAQSRISTRVEKIGQMLLPGPAGYGQLLIEAVLVEDRLFNFRVFLVQLGSRVTIIFPDFGDRNVSQ